MNDLTAELHALAAELIAAGVPATVDPGQVLRLVTQAGVCAQIRPAQVQPGWGSGALDLTVPVRLLTSSPYDHQAVERVDEALLLALPVVQPREPADWGVFDADGAEFPGRELTAYRRIPFPSTVPT
jgi:hypothetical protein